MSEQEQRVKQLRDGFFGLGNKIKLTDLSGDHPIPRCARLWLDELEHPGEGQLPPVVLPRKTDGPSQWYGIAFSAGQSRDLREQLTAFAGPTLSTFRGQTRPLDPDDPVEAAILQATGSSLWTAKFGAPDVAIGRQLTDALMLMARVRQGAEVRATELAASTGRVLRDFEYALRSGRREKAEERLSYLRRHRRLDPVNLQFLEVQLRAELGAWDELLALPHFADLVQARRPRAVTRALLTALFTVHLRRAEASGDGDALLEFFEREVRPRSGNLFAVRAGDDSLPVLKTFLALAVLSRDVQLRDDLWPVLKTSPELNDDERAFWQNIAERLPFAPPSEAPSVDPLNEATRAVFEGDFDRAWAVAWPLDASSTRAGVLLLCADAMATLQAQRAALDAVEALEELSRTALLANKALSAAWERLLKQGEPQAQGTTIPGSWSQWLELVTDASCSDARLQRFAAQGSTEWAVASLLDDANALDALAAQLETLSGDLRTRDRLLDGLPHLLRFLERDDEFPRPAFKSLYNALRVVLAYFGESGDLAQWSVYADLTRIVLDLGVAPNAYASLLDETRGLWTNRLAMSNLEAALDVLDLLFVHPCPQLEARNQLASDVLSQAGSWFSSRHFDEETRRFCRQLADDYRLDALLPNDVTSSEEDGDVVQTETDPLARLVGRSIVLYTLTQSAAVRARDLILARCPDCFVQLNHDKAGSADLQHLAQNADVFVMVTASAKHAATDCIEAHRAANAPLLRVHARGSSSILRGLVEWSSGLSATGTH